MKRKSPITEIASMRPLGRESDIPIERAHRNVPRRVIHLRRGVDGFKVLVTGDPIYDERSFRVDATVDYGIEE